jgi:hypothetical protein
MEPDKRETQPGHYLTGQVVAAYSGYASLLRVSGALHLGIFEQPAKSDFFSIMLGLGLSFFAAVPFFAEPVTLPGFKIGEHLLPTPYLLPPVDGSLRLSLFKSRTQYPHLFTIKSNLFFDLIIRHLKSLLSISFNFSNISSSFNDNTHPFFCPQSSGSAQLSRILTSTLQKIIVR